MKLIFQIALFLFLLPVLGFAQNQYNVGANHLMGEWIIDLRPTPESEGYFQTFAVVSTVENRIEGSFYGSPIEMGLINSNWDKVYFAFTTKDKNNSYYHSGYLMDGLLFGQTYCPDRNFTAPWTGKKE